MQVLCLAPPGMCPGHFDLSPGQVRQLADCHLLFRADFQHRIEESLTRMKENGLKVISIPSLAGMCIPDNYLGTCRDVADALCKYDNGTWAALCQSRLVLVEQRLARLSKQITAAVDEAQLRSAPVLASDHQADFARWLGLDVVATFVGSDIETAANLQQSLEKARRGNVRLVIANRQEGTELAHALADTLDGRLVVLSNFPEMQPYRDNFDALVMSNVRALLDTGRL